MIIPPTKPKLGAARVFAIAEGNNDLGVACVLPSGKIPAVAVVAARAYRRDSMGKPGVNDAGIYDDAVFLLIEAALWAYNANVDPSIVGWNSALGKPFANLKTGLWYFIKGHHKKIPKAFRQADEEQAEEYNLPKHGHFTVVRDDGKGHRYDDTGYFAINIHPGSNGGTSSWGCQTLPPRADHWWDFQERAYEAMHRHGQKVLPYLLINGPLSD